MKEEYISISEFAKRAGVSHQAIYKRLNTDLQPWLQVAKHKKSLNIKALDLFDIKKIATDSTEVATVKLLQKTVDILQHELEIKNSQIEELNKRLSESNAALLSAQQTAQAAQALHAGMLKQQSLEEKDKKEETRIDIGNDSKKWFEFWK